MCKEVLVSKFAWDFHEFLSPVMFEMFSIVVKSSTHSITNSSKTTLKPLHCEKKLMHAIFDSDW